MPWESFLDEIRQLPKGQLWRHSQAGDLQGENGVIDAIALKQLVKANKGKRGWSYSHYPPTPHNIKAIRHANRNGLTINLSADSLDEADALAKHGLPLVTVVPIGWTAGVTPAGRRVTVCPAQRMEHMTCAVCQLCQKSERHAIVAFEAHGARQRTVMKVVQFKTKEAHESENFGLAP